MRIVFIRHGKTAGNIEKRYIGRTDEPLCAEGISELKARKYPDCERVITSPMKRCIETAKLIYPNREMIICDDLRECDFGDFEGKNYLELSNNSDYQRWIDSGGTLPFPNGESPEGFKARCVRGFLEMIGQCDGKTAAFVVHGGTIMAIFERFGFPKRGYYDYQAENGSGYIAEFDGVYLKITEKL